MDLPDPVFPPLLAGHAVAAGAVPFQLAIAGAKAGDFGAGDLLWSRAVERIELALVLEPEVGADRVSEMLFLAMVATTDAIGALIPPEIALTYLWPATLRANGATVGRVRLAHSAELDESGAPAWLVVGISLQLAPLGGPLEPGEVPHLTSLVDEGGTELDRTQAIESLSRHLLTWIHTWDVDGFGPVLENWLFRADGYRAEIVLETRDGPRSGRFVGLDERGNLLMKPDKADSGQTLALPLDDALAYLDELEERP
ncbi:biotin/lipoate--protein ligase family protein [Stappia sp.]|uniref:biotin/lipoate--protein ligase family protein n=1 Tax=Stappia sp. TaxID=1870903 RepID=UPI003A99098E